MNNHYIPYLAIALIVIAAVQQFVSLFTNSQTKNISVTLLLIAAVFCSWFSLNYFHGLEKQANNNDLIKIVVSERLANYTFLIAMISLAVKTISLSFKKTISTK